MNLKDMIDFERNNGVFVENSNVSNISMMYLYSNSRYRAHKCFEEIIPSKRQNQFGCSDWRIPTREVAFTLKEDLKKLFRNNNLYASDVIFSIWTDDIIKESNGRLLYFNCYYNFILNKWGLRETIGKECKAYIVFVR